jgi:hypothetical protein
MSEKINDGGPAFPNSKPTTGEDGMSLRDWFAGQALAGLVGSECIHLAIPNGAQTDKSMAQMSFELADAMLRAREVQP